MPTVSILIPTKDRPDLLRRAVESAPTQTYSDIEVIVQNGGGKVALPDDRRLTVLNEPDQSIANGVNRAAYRSSGRIMHFACDDDVMRPNAVAAAVESLRTARAQWTYGCIMLVQRPEDCPPAKPLVDRHGNAVLRGRVSSIGEQGGLPWDMFTYAKHGNYVPQPSVFWTRHAWELCGPMDETLPLCFDYEMWGRFGSRWPPAVTGHVAADYTVWDGSTSVHSQAAQRREVKTIQSRWGVYGVGRREGE